MTTQFIAIVKRTKEVTTKDGRRCTIIEASGNMKSEFAIWLGANHTAALALKTGDRITCTVDSKGKERWVENVPVTRPSTGFETPSPYQPSSPYSPLATLPKAETTPENTGAAIDRHIEDLAVKMAKCVQAIRSQIPGLDSESEQKYATSLFIQVCKDSF